LSVHGPEFEMKTLIILVRYEIEFLLAALAAVVTFQILTRRITTTGLLSVKDKKGVASFSPARLQLLMFTVATAAYVLSKVMSSIANDPIPTFPEIDPNVLIVLGASHAVYLGAKTLSPSGSNPDTSNQ
jgi:hypothetical protein